MTCDWYKNFYGDNQDMYAFTLKQIKKYFTGVKALKGVDLTINKGEIHCLAGENGCGKSTLGRAIANLIKYEDKIKYQGKDLQSYNSKEMKNLNKLTF